MQTPASPTGEQAINISGISRRTVVQASTAVAVAPLVGCAASPAGITTPMTVSPGGEPDPVMMRMNLNVNGKGYPLTIDGRTSLLDALRENLNLKGSKKGCDHGQCGACTVLVDGKRINSCLTLAVMHEGQAVTTIEGLSKGEELHPMQAAFLKHDGFQCGYCTPGQICSSVGMLSEVRAGMPSHVTQNLQGTAALNDDEIRERMSGNICRCSAYPNIVAAIRDAAGVRA
jgi:xanthine dehydrogenase YagT iron-sulfur-binding subunit